MQGAVGAYRTVAEKPGPAVIKRIYIGIPEPFPPVCPRRFFLPASRFSAVSVFPLLQIIRRRFRDIYRIFQDIHQFLKCLYRPYIQGIDYIVAARGHDRTAQLKIIAIPQVFRPVHKIPFVRHLLQKTVFPLIAPEMPDDPLRRGKVFFQESPVAGKLIIQQQELGPEKRKIRHLLHIIPRSHRHQSRAYPGSMGELRDTFPQHPYIPGKPHMGMRCDERISQILPFLSCGAVQVCLLCPVFYAVFADPEDPVQSRVICGEHTPGLIHGVMAHLSLDTRDPDPGT